MRIKITSDATAKTVFELAGDGRAGPDSMDIKFQSGIETLAYLRAAGIENADRGNDIVSIDFSIWKTFGSAVDCTLYCLDIRSAVPKVGRVDIIETSGGSKGVRTIEHASIGSISPKAIGKTANIRFSITGGVVIQTKNYGSIY